jgi:hypothetical protein
MAMLPPGDVSFSQNNKLVDTHKMGPEEKLKIILGTEPTISVSTIDKEHQVLAGDFGVILKGGDVLAGYNKDAGVALGSNIYDRKSKYDRNLNTSTIQNDIVSNIDRSINSKEKDGWNELVVENPKVAGLFYQINVNKSGNTFAALGTSMNYAYEISKNLNLPLYILDGDKISKLDETAKELKEVNMNDVLESGRDISNNEKKDYIEEMIDKEAFKGKRENIHYFNAYNNGKKNFVLKERNINSYLKEREEELKTSSEKIEKLKKEGEEFSLHTKKSLLFNIYGFMEECKKSGYIENYENENEEEYENNKYKSNYELNNEYDDLVKISQEEKQCDNKFLDTNQILETKNLRKKKMIIWFAANF